mgnify:CR=1 FL=1
MLNAYKPSMGRLWFKVALPLIIMGLKLGALSAMCRYSHAVVVLGGGGKFSPLRVEAGARLVLKDSSAPVSYTHLTLPTTERV